MPNLLIILNIITYYKSITYGSGANLMPGIYKAKKNRGY